MQREPWSQVADWILGLSQPSDTSLPPGTRTWVNPFQTPTGKVICGSWFTGADGAYHIDIDIDIHIGLYLCIKNVECVDSYLSFTEGKPL